MLWAVNSMLQCQQSLTLSRGFDTYKKRITCLQQIAQERQNCKSINKSRASNGNKERNKNNPTTFKYNMCQVMD